MPAPHDKTVAHTVCRFCHAQCGLLVELKDGRPVKVYGDKDDPAYHGFSCIKGRALPSYHTDPERLLTSMKRLPGGDHARIGSEQALDEIAAKLTALIETYGPRSVAIYVGTNTFNNLAAHALANAFMAAIGSPMTFTSVTIDQPGKAIAGALHGTWLAGSAMPDESDAWMLIGTNPIVSMLGLSTNPARLLKQAREGGMSLIVVDPRETDVAKMADLYIQPKPGEDPTFLAGVIREVFANGWQDQAFLDAHASGVEALKAAVEPYTPDYVAERCAIPKEKLLAAARLYGTARKGGINAGTGPNMSGRGNLTEYLLTCLMSVCGHWRREGDVQLNPGVLINAMPPIAASSGQRPAWGFGEKLRVRGLTNTAAGLPTAALADEILMPGDGQVKALFNLGGNPMMAWPDQLKTKAALEQLELLVSLDPRMSATGLLSDYVIAPTLHFETMGNTALQEWLGNLGIGWGYSAPYAQHCEALQPPPAGSDVIDDWELFYGLGRRMGLDLTVKPFSHLDPAAQDQYATRLDMQTKPTTHEIWEATLAGSPVPYAAVRNHKGGRLYERERPAIQPRPEDWPHRLELGAAAMMAELEEIQAEPVAGRHGEYAFTVISRRLRDWWNSSWPNNPAMTRRHDINPAFMNPADIAEYGLVDGDVILLHSARSAIRGVVAADADVRRGCISMTHCRGHLPGTDDDVFTWGGNTGRLSNTEADYDPYTGIPRMSTIPVNIEKLEMAAEAAE